MTLSKLAFKNMKTQFRDYFVYFVSMSFSIMVYFTFILMAYSPILKKVAEKKIKIVLLEVYRNIMTRPMTKCSRTQDS